MDNEIRKILEKKIDETKKGDQQIKQIIGEFSNLDSNSFSSGIMIGRLFNSFYYQHRRILKKNPTEEDFNDFLKFLKKELN